MASRADSTRPGCSRVGSRTSENRRWIREMTIAEIRNEDASAVYAASRTDAGANRPASGPPTNMNSANGTVSDAYTAATSPGERVREKTRPASATNRNQSPVNDTTWAKKSRRKSRLRRRRDHAAPRARGGGAIDP